MTRKNEYYFISINKRKFIFWSFVIPLFYTIFLSAIIFLFFKDEINTSNKVQEVVLIKRILYGILLAPFIETLFFQYLPVELFKLFTRNKELLIVFISGLLFGFAHYFNNHDYLFSMAAFFAGILFASIYIFAKKRGDISFPFLLVFCIHSVINLISLSINYYYDLN